MPEVDVDVSRTALAPMLTSSGDDDARRVDDSTGCCRRYAATFGREASTASFVGVEDGVADDDGDERSVILPQTLCVVEPPYSTDVLTLSAGEDTSAERTPSAGTPTDGKPVEMPAERTESTLADGDAAVGPATFCEPAPMRASIENEINPVFFIIQ